ncbi:hypothetical protein CBW56_14205 [Denitratisoma oestradiolicum]|nr:hypothetical protein CBW56_14205 [Denitratisoma oestradiolicum]
MLAGDIDGAGNPAEAVDHVADLVAAAVVGGGHGPIGPVVGGGVEIGGRRAGAAIVRHAVVVLVGTVAGIDGHIAPGGEIAGRQVGLFQRSGTLGDQPGASGFDAAIRRDGGALLESQIAGDDHARSHLTEQDDPGHGHGQQHDQGNDQDHPLLAGPRRSAGAAGTHGAVPQMALRKGIMAW